LARWWGRARQGTAKGGRRHPTSGARLDVYPFFREDTRCSVCELMRPLASPSGVEHRFRVFLPPGYHENTLKRYPVLYMHDGHNLFFKEEAFVGNTWRTDEVLNTLDKMNAIEEVIAIGIFPNDRTTEYTMPGYEDQLADGTLQKRVADPREIVGPVLYLASDASSFVTGDDISVSGGMPK